jgi:hypothetical protein
MTLGKNMTMKGIFVLLAFACLLAGAAPSWGQGLPDKATEVLEAIRVLRTDPLGKDAPQAMTKVGEYAHSESSVMVIVRASYFPELDTVGPQNFNLLMASYLAGNMEPQIINARTVDHPLDGMKAMLHTYRLLREKDAIDEIRDFERWKFMGDEELGTLLKKLKASDTLPENPLGVIQ